MSKRFIFVAAALWLAVAPALANESAYSPTQGPTCRQQRAESELGAWECRGPAGYSAAMADAGVSVGVDLHSASQPSRPGSGVSWPGRFGKLIEWRLAEGAPVAAILRIWRSLDPNAPERQREELLVMKVSARGACRVGAIPAQQAKANDAARAMADGVTAATPCADDF